MTGIDAIEDSIRALAEIETAKATVAESGHEGHVRLRATPVCFIWDPTPEEWEAAARRHAARVPNFAARAAPDPEAPGPGSVPYPFGEEE